MQLLESALHIALAGKEHVTIACKPEGCWSVQDGALGLPADFLALALHHTFSFLSDQDEDSSAEQSSSVLMSLALVSDRVATDLVLATQLREADPSLDPDLYVAKAGTDVKGWQKWATRQRVESLIDVIRTVKAAQELMREQMSEDILVKRAAHRRMHTLLQLNIQETVQPPTCLRLMGLTGVPGVCLKSAMQLAHSISDPSWPAPTDLGEGLWSLIQPVPDSTHRAWLATRNSTGDPPWQLECVLDYTPPPPHCPSPDPSCDDDDCFELPLPPQAAIQLSMSSQASSLSSSSHPSRVASAREHTTTPSCPPCTTTDSPFEPTLSAELAPRTPDAHVAPRMHEPPPATAFKLISRLRGEQQQQGGARQGGVGVSSVQRGTEQPVKGRGEGVVDAGVGSGGMLRRMNSF